MYEPAQSTKSPTVPSPEFTPFHTPHAWPPSASTLPHAPHQPRPARTEFSLRDDHGERHSLSDFRGRGVVIYFYPEDDTPLCTAQACQFRDHQGEFSKVGCSIIGISPDDQTSHAAFIAKHHLPFPLLADETDRDGNPRVSTLYGAWGDKNMYGKIVRAMLRTTYLIGPDGRIARRWDRVKTPGHAAQVLAAAKAQHAGGLTGLIREAKPPKHPKKTTRARGAGRASYAVSARPRARTRPRATRARKNGAQSTRAKARPR